MNDLANLMIFLAGSGVEYFKYTDPQFSTLEKLADVLGVRIKDLLD